MDEQTKDKKLDVLLEQAVNSGNVEFDAEKWKQKYGRQYSQLVSRAEQGVTCRRVFSIYAVRFAAAAVILVAAGLLIHWMHRPTDTPQAMQLAQSPAKATTMLSLSLAYREGGIEAVEERFRRAWRDTRIEVNSLSVAELLNGKG